MDRILEAFLDSVDAERYGACGSVSPPPPEDRICQWCEGVGIREKIREERKCPTCDGKGEVDPDGMPEEEWEELYGDQAPVAQRTERPAPTREAAGSIPARGTSHDKEENKPS